MQKIEVYIIQDKETRGLVLDEGRYLCFETKLTAQNWCESNGVDYDYYKIKKAYVNIGSK